MLVRTSCAGEARVGLRLSIASRARCARWEAHLRTGLSCPPVFYARGFGLRCTSLCAACVFGLWCGMLVHMLAGLRAMVGHGVQCWPPVFLWDCGVSDVLCVFFSSLQLRFRVGHLRCGGPLDRFWCGWMVWTLQSIFIAWSWFLGMLPVVCDWWCRVVMSSR